jgi:dihydrofolate reductase
MRKIIVSEFITVDGVMEAPGGEKSLGERSGWTFPYGSDEQMKFKHEELFAADAILLGRVTYDGFAAAWPNLTGMGDFGERMNSIPKFVVSKTAEKLEWNNSTLIKENVVEEITKLKQMPGKDILVFGSAELLQTLVQNDLVDEYRLMVFPVVLGIGKHLFKDGDKKAALKLIGTKIFASGVIVLTYEPERK